MIKTILGLILLLFPFLLIYKFKDKKTGFACILSLLMAFHLILAVFLQFFGIFNYLLILGINLIAALIISRKINFKTLTENIKNINPKKIDWVLIFVIIILFIQLYSVHYDYTGIVTSTNESYKEVKNMKYPYPYFSDEWSAVTFIKYSIESGKLPLTNPYWYNNFFPNLELPFHSFLSEIILLLNLNPLTHYTILTLFSGILICILVYFILRINKIGKLASSIASLSIPYIVNSANLPGIWNLIPVILGVISMLLTLLFISINNKKMILFTAFLTLVFYPPLFLFSTASLLSYFISTSIKKKEKRKYILIYFLIIIIAAVFVSVFTYLHMGFSLKSFIFSYIKGKLLYPTITTDSIPNFAIWRIIPIPILLLSAFGIFKLSRIKKKVWLVAPVIVGLIYWLLYSFILLRIFIGYARVVVATSILIVLLSGFGLQYAINYLKKLNFIKQDKILTILQIIILIFFFILIFSYTQRDNWKELKLHSVVNDGIFKPAAPASNYLHEDDLKLFGNIERKNFLSPSWKGTVIGTATNNYPLNTKAATLTNQIFSFNKFTKASCAEKRKIADQKKIDYIYSREFDCKGFDIRGISGEGLHLYKVVREEP